MADITEGIAAEEGGGGNLLSRFAELPSGVQRLIIAVMIVLILVAAVFIQRLIKTEEAVSEEMDVFEAEDTFITEDESAA